MGYIINEYTMAEAYQPLFDILSKEHGLTLIKSEMDEIIAAVDKVNENLTELWRIVCDVEDCNETSCNQGSYWKDKGYWCVCTKHSDYGRKGGAFPQMKGAAIEREKIRASRPDGTLS